MGGFYNAVADLAKGAVEKIGSKVAANPVAVNRVAEGVETGLYHGMFRPEAAFQDIPAAKHLWDTYQGPYKEQVNQLTSKGVEQAKLAGGTKPAADITKEAQKQASENVFGPNRSGIQAVLKHVEKTVGKNRADILADHLNILFKESPDAEGLSKFDRDMRKGNEDTRFQTPPSKYRDPNLIEKAGRVHQSILAYKAAIPHLTSNLNILMSDGFQTYAKVLDQTFNPSTRKGAEATVLATNAISELTMNGYREHEAFKAGKISQYMPGSVGEFIHKNMYIPGMSSVRYNTLLMSAHASKLAADEAVQNLARGNGKKALPVLRELGLDPMKIQAQKFQLDASDIQKAYYHGTNVRAFLNQGEGRTALGQSSPIFRVMGAFHSYTANQARFIQNVFKRQYQQGDFVGIARNIGLMSMAFPVLGATLYEAERLLIGHDWDDPGKHLANRVEATPAGVVYDALAGRQNAASAARIALNTIDSLSHLASFGVATGYTRGAARNNLAGQIMGPNANMLIQGAQDAYKAAHTDNRHPDAWKPLARDAMADTTPYGIGGVASHQILPTKADSASGKPKRFRRTRPKPDSNNPLNANDFNY